MIGINDTLNYLIKNAQANATKKAMHKKNVTNQLCWIFRGSLTNKQRLAAEQFVIGTFCKLLCKTENEKIFNVYYDLFQNNLVNNYDLKMSILNDRWKEDYHLDNPDCLIASAVESIKGSSACLFALLDFYVSLVYLKGFIDEDDIGCICNPSSIPFVIPFNTKTQINVPTKTKEMKDNTTSVVSSTKKDIDNSLIEKKQNQEVKTHISTSRKSTTDFKNVQTILNDGSIITISVVTSINGLKVLNVDLFNNEENVDLINNLDKAPYFYIFPGDSYEEKLNEMMNSYKHARKDFDPENLDCFVEYAEPLYFILDDDMFVGNPIDGPLAHIVNPDDLIPYCAGDFYRDFSPYQYKLILYKISGAPNIFSKKFYISDEHHFFVEYENNVFVIVLKCLL